MNATSDEIATLEALRDELRDLMREAHGVLKDLGRATKDAKAAFPALAADQIERVVKAETAIAGQAMAQAQDQAVEKIFAEFDKLSKLIMGSTASDRRRGRRPLSDLLATPGVLQPAGLMATSSPPPPDPITFAGRDLPANPADPVGEPAPGDGAAGRKPNDPRIRRGGPRGRKHI